MNEPVRLPFMRLCGWSAGIAVFGLVFAAMLREQIIPQEALRFPTGTASALLVDVLHGSAKSQPDSDYHDSVASSAVQPPSSNNRGLQLQQLHWRSSLFLISTGVGASAAYVRIIHYTEGPF